MPNPASASLIHRIRHGLIPAVPAPFRKFGVIHKSAQEQYAQWMATQPIAGVAVWAHTGRGLHLSHEQRAGIFKTWRAALPDKPIIAGVGGNPLAKDSDEFFASARAMAEHAASLGADAILAYPPAFLNNLEGLNKEHAIHEYHSLLAGFHIPLILFYLYEAAGGVAYSDAVLDELLSMPEVAGIKIATLDSIVTFQNIARRCEMHHTDKLIITGEDRFFGYSLMCGAQAALVGLGSACCELQAAMMNAYFSDTADSRDLFFDLSKKTDRLASVTFNEPIEGYIRRMLWVLVEQKIIPEDAAHDPWGPELGESQRIILRHTLKELALHEEIKQEENFEKSAESVADSVKDE